MARLAWQPGVDGLQVLPACVLQLLLLMLQLLVMTCCLIDRLRKHAGLVLLTPWCLLLLLLLRTLLTWVPGPSWALLLLWAPRFGMLCGVSVLQLQVLLIQLLQLPPGPACLCWGQLWAAEAGWHLAG